MKKHYQSTYKQLKKTFCNDPSMHSEYFTPDVISLFRNKTEFDKKCRWLLCPYYNDCDLDGWGEQDNERDYAHELCKEIMFKMSHYDGNQANFGFVLADSIYSNMTRSDKYIPTKRQVAALEAVLEDL